MRKFRSAHSFFLFSSFVMFFYEEVRFHVVNVTMKNMHHKLSDLQILQWQFKIIMSHMVQFVVLSVIFFVPSCCA